MRKQQKALLEAIYRLPASGRTAMYDFYALLALWKDVGGSEIAHSGFPVTVVSPDRRVGTVTDLLASCSKQLAQKLGVAALTAAEDELENVADETLIPPTVYRDWAVTTGDSFLVALYSGVADRVILPTNPIKTLGIGRVTTIFAADFWAKHADLYGGTKWVVLINVAEKLIDASKNGMALKDLVMLIDKFYDMEHNTAAIATKMGDFSIEKVDLDVRSRITGTQTFAQYTSPVVAGALQASASYSREPVDKLVIARITKEKRDKFWTISTDDAMNTLLTPKDWLNPPGQVLSGSPQWSKTERLPALPWPKSGAFYGKPVDDGIEIDIQVGQHNEKHVYPAYLFDVEQVEHLTTRQLLAVVAV